MDLEGKVALVTGASSGIGAAIARRLAAQGVKVGLAARRAARLRELEADIRAGGGQALALEMDVTDAGAVAAGAQALLQAHGRIDVLVNNAGLMPASDVDQLKTDEWNRMVDVNIKGVLNATAAVLPAMRRQQGGHVFNVSSIAGRKVFAGLSVYCATKFAVAAFSDGLRMEVGKKHGIRVTCIQPGAVETELYEQISDPVQRGQMEALRGQMTFLRPDDIADTVLFALRAPDRVNVAELFVLPVDQPW